MHDPIAAYPILASLKVTDYYQRAKSGFGGNARPA
jgi:hypothetical protein